MPKRDDLAAGLDQLTAGPGGGTTPKVIQLYGDRPEVLDAIRRARSERHLSFKQIAVYLSANGPSISEGAVQTWLNKQGID